MTAVSIILPTYNRSHFLDNAFQSLLSQTFKEWELIIVDDGSTDNTEKKVKELQSKNTFPIRYCKRENGGAALARNTGVPLAKGEFIAFFDSDDYWDADHLSRAISALKKNPSLDWLYFACRRKDFLTGELLLPSTFYTNNQKNPLFSCASHKSDDIYFLENEKAALCQIEVGIDSGLQNSVFRRHIFNKFLLPNFRVGEDRLFILQILKANFKGAFVDRVTVTYNVHDNNTSDTNLNESNKEKRILAMERLIASYIETFKLSSLSLREKNALRKRLSEDYVWKLGYSLQRENGNYRDAAASMIRGIRYWPFKLSYWKTLLVTLFKGVKGG